MRIEPFRIHAAIFNSLRTIEALGAGKERVMFLNGQYSRVLNNTAKRTNSKFIRSSIVSMNEICSVRWRVDCLKDSASVSEILKDVYDKDGVPDVILQGISFCLPLQRRMAQSMQLETMHLEWMFYPYTFRRGLWERLKAIDFPGQRLYTRFAQLRREVIKSLDKETAKRWRDTLMMNRPNPKLSNDDIRQVWEGRPWVLLLKESKGNFELMDISESRT